MSQLRLDYSPRSTLVQTFPHLTIYLRVAIVLVQEGFESIEQIANLAIKLDNKLHRVPDASTASYTPTTNPNAMDIFASFTGLTDKEGNDRLQTGSCFKCGVQGHRSNVCPERQRDQHDRSSKGKGNYQKRIAELEVKLAAMGGNFNDQME